MNEIDRLQPLETESNDFAWPPPRRDAEDEILWLEPDVEPAPKSDFPALVPKPAASAGVSIADLLASDIAFEWPEVVALVQELGSGLRNSGPSRSLLSLDAIMLGPDGRLRVSVEPGTIPIVRSVGHVLDQLLTNHPGPANLRLIALQANSEASTFASPEDLARSLATFERPGRLKALTALHERVRQVGIRPVSPVAPPAKFEHQPEPIPRPIVAAEPEDQAQTQQPPVKQRQNRGRMAVFAVVSVCIALTGVAVAMRLRPQPLPAPEAPRAAVETLQASAVSHMGVPAREMSLLFPPAERLGPGATDSPARKPGSLVPRGDGARVTGTGSAAASVAATSVAARAVAARSVAAVPVAAVPVAAAPVAAAPMAAAPMAAAPMAAAPVPARSAPAVRFPAGTQIPPVAETEFVRARRLFDGRQYAAAAAGFQRVINILSNGELSPSSSILRSTAAELAAISLAAVSTIPDERVYTRLDEGVTEPVSIRTFLPQEISSGTIASDLSELELLIDAQGAVESVRLRNPQNRYRDKWWLAAAKAWRFQPAMKDGLPVRFLKRMPITAFEPTDPQ